MEGKKMRKHKLALLIISSALAISAAAMFAHPLQDDTATLLKKEALQAIDKADFAEGDGLLSTDYVGLRAPDGRVLSALSGASMLYTSIDGQGLQASVFGNTAVVTGIVRVNGSENGNATVAGYRYSRIYTNQSGQWQPVFTQFTRMHQ